MFAVAALALLFISGCATVLHGRQDTVYVNSLENGTRIYIDGVERGIGSALAQIKRGEKHSIRVSKAGCEDVLLQTTDAFDLVSLLGILFDFGIISIPTDLISGAAWKLEPTIYTVTPVCPGSLPDNALPPGLQRLPGAPSPATSGGV